MNMFDFRFFILTTFSKGSYGLPRNSGWSGKGYPENWGRQVVIFSAQSCEYSYTIPNIQQKYEFADYFEPLMTFLIFGYFIFFSWLSNQSSDLCVDW